MRYKSEEQEKVTRKTLEFLRILKEADVRISTAETLDMFTALQYVDFSDKTSFKQTLSTSLIKDYTDLPIFDKCFQEFFEKKGSGKGEDIDSAVRDALERQSPGDNAVISGDDLKRLEAEIDAFLDSLPEELLFTRPPKDILNIMLEDPQASSASGALGMLIMNTRSRNRAQSGGESEEDTADEEAQGILLPIIQRRMRERSIGKVISRREDYLLHKYIHQLKPAEIQEMRELIKRFGQKLKNRVSLRKKKMKHGGLDVKRTFRFNLKYGGVPFKLYYRNKKIDRPQLVVMCDISSSVNQYSRFMLLLTYTLQGLFSKVRTFAFISNMVEITGLFMEMDPERALNSIFTDTDFTYGFGSNYGRCFNQFYKDHSDSLTRKTTVLILGDGRNNYQDPGLESFIRIRERSRNLFWLNPDRRHLWGWADSIANLYQAHCTEMKEVNNFLDLSEFIDKLFVK